MNILMLTGSPRANGTSAFLADHFRAGAEAAGHTVRRFDTAFMELSGCRGCGHCRQFPGVCAIKDDYGLIRDALLAADLVTLVTPLYFFDMTAQLKQAVDRFYMISPLVQKMPAKRAMLLSTCGIDREWAFDGLKAHYPLILRYLKWKDAGQLYAPGMVQREDIERSNYGEQAFAMGRGLSDDDPEPFRKDIAACSVIRI